MAEITVEFLQGEADRLLEEQERVRQAFTQLQEQVRLHEQTLLRINGALIHIQEMQEHLAKSEE